MGQLNSIDLPEPGPAALWPQCLPRAVGGSGFSYLALSLLVVGITTAHGTPARQPTPPRRSCRQGQGRFWRGPTCCAGRGCHRTAWRPARLLQWTRHRHRLQHRHGSQSRRWSARQCAFKEGQFRPRRRPSRARSIRVLFRSCLNRRWGNSPRTRRSAETRK